MERQTYIYALKHIVRLQLNKMKGYAFLTTLTIFLFIGSVTCQDHIYDFYEEQTDVTFIGNVARDLNLAFLVSPPSVFDQLRYSIMVGEDGNLFRISAINSDLFAKQKLDRESVCRFEVSCDLKLKVSARSETAMWKFDIVVRLLDVNDNAPKFNESLLRLAIPESVNVGSKFNIPGAIDDDRGQTNIITTYSLTPDDGLFGVEYFQKLDGTSDVSLIVLKSLDREAKDSYSLQLVAKDGGTPQRSATLQLEIQVEDINDNSPSFPQSKYFVEVGENTVPGALIIPLTAKDNDLGVNARLAYRLSFHQDASVAELFEIDRDSGDLRAKVALNSGSYAVIVEAVDGGMPSKVNQTEVFVTVIDTENSAPEIMLDTYNRDDPNIAYIAENASLKAIVAHVTVLDSDTGSNGAIRCYSQSAVFDLQSLEDSTYVVVVAKPLDRENTQSYYVTLYCEDFGSPRLNATKTFKVIVKDVNDNPPVFDQPDVTVSVAEGNMPNDVLILVSASDQDAGENAKLYFTLLDDSDGKFHIGLRSNALSMPKSLDRETEDVHVLKILAKDGGNPALYATATVTVSVLDINDESPEFFQSRYEFAVLEGLPSGTVVGSVSAFDRDLGDGGQLSFSLPPSSETHGKFGMMPNGTLLTTTPLDREATGKFSFQVLATDNGNPRRASEVTVVVRVLDINDNRPVFLFPSPSNHSVSFFLPLETTSSLLTIKVIDVDEGANGEVYFYLHPGNATKVFFLDEVTGQLFATRDLGLDDLGVYNLTITARDNADVSMDTTKFLVVNLVENPVLTPAQTSNANSNTMIVIILICATVLVSIIIVLIVCFVRRRDSGKDLRYLNNATAPNQSTPRPDSSAPPQYDKQGEMTKDFSLHDDADGISSAPKLSVGFPGSFDQYNLQLQPGVRMSVDSMAKAEEADTQDKELNRVTSLRLQQAFQHISSIKSRLITPSDTSKPYEWREIHIPGNPGEFGSLSSRGTNTNPNIDSGVGTDDDQVFMQPQSRTASPSRHKSNHHHHHHHHHQPPHHLLHHMNPHLQPRFSSQPPSDVSADSSHPSCSSLPNLCLKPGSDVFVFRPLSARSSESYPSPSDTFDDQCTTTSGSYSINLEDPQHNVHPHPRPHPHPQSHPYQQPHPHPHHRNNHHPKLGVQRLHDVVKDVYV